MKKTKIIRYISAFTIISVVILYGIIFYKSPIIDQGKRSFIEKTIDFLSFGWHFTKASIYSDYLKKNEIAKKELGKAGWHRKTYLAKKFGVRENDLKSVLEIYRNLEINSILEKLYVFLLNEKNYETAFLREAGDFFINNGYWKMAVEAHSKLIVLHPDNSMTHYYLGLGYLKLKKLNDAQKCFERATKLKPDFADAYFQLGVIAEKMNEWERAQSFYEKTINILPNHLDSLKALKRIYKKLK